MLTVPLNCQDAVRGFRNDELDFQLSRRKVRKQKLRDFRSYGAAPSPTSRVTPTGIWIPDGIHTYHTNALDPDVSLWEMEVKPSGFNAGEPIPQDSMWNIRYKMKRSQQLIEGTPSTVKFKYDPNLKAQIISMIGIETTLTETYYDGSQAAYFGYWQSVEFDPLVPGQLGTGSLTIMPTNFDKTNRVEAGPYFSNVAGS